MSPAAKDVDAYLAAAPAEAQPMLAQLRKLIRAAAPKAQETISYQIPAYKYEGRPLVYFGAAKKHCGLYGIGSSVIVAFQEELEGYAGSKGTIQFPLNKPLPARLVTRLVKAQAAENEALAAKKQAGARR